MRYVLGLDLGITSVGWAVLNYPDRRIEDLGVRAFNCAEQPKTGAPLAEPRRLARGMRRRLRRRAARLHQVKDLCVQAQLIPATERETAFLTGKDKPDPWQLRAEGIERKLSGEELARVLFHLAKRRGFKSNRKATKDTDEGKLLCSVQQNRRLMEEKGYRTAGEMLYRDEKFGEHRRNKADSYENTVDRALLDEEAQTLLARQRKFGNLLATEQLEEEFLRIFRKQLPFASASAILEKIGACTLEPEELRAPRCSYTAERFSLLERVNHLKYEDEHGQRQSLSDEQRQQIIALTYKNAEVTYKQIRKELQLPATVTFAALTYMKRVNGVYEKSDDCEKTSFCALRGYHALRKLFAKTEYWERLCADYPLMDALAFAFTVYKTDDDISAYLRERHVPEEIVTVALDGGADLTKFSHLSLKAMRKILPYLEDGEVYSKACELAGYDHSVTGQCCQLDKLPPIDREALRINNPVVLRALAQARKVVNAVITRYGAPTAINIELAREMGKTFDERKTIAKEQGENLQRRVANEQLFYETFPGHARPSGEDLLKLRLYREQDCKCAYSQHGLDTNRLLEPGYVEIDHILPYSRSFDDSMVNKALVLSGENQRKRNQTPYEYLHTAPDRWAAFEAWVVATIHDPSKRRHYLEKNFDEQKAKEWKARNLNDTKFIARAFSNFLRDNLRFADPDMKNAVVCVKGGMTAMARGLWGLAKVREENDLHHALDAAIVATFTPKQVQRITVYRQARETMVVPPEGPFVDPETGEEIVFHAGRHFALPQPWNHFRAELLARLSENPQAAIANLGLASYTNIDQPKAILVSRMPQRKISGALHQETIRSLKFIDQPERVSAGRTVQPVSVSRVRLVDLKMEKLERLVCPQENVKLYSAIRARLAEYGGDAKKAFGDPANPFRKPTNDGSPGPIVRSVKLYETQVSGVMVRNGIANNGDMIFVDVFQRQGKFYLAPAYVTHAMRGELPNRVIVAHKPEEEWPVIDETYQFLFRLYKYDLVKITTKTGEIFGYYRETDRGNGSIKVCWPNNGDRCERTGVKLATKIEKFEVDVLGNKKPVKSEVRRGLESHHHQQSGTLVG